MDKEIDRSIALLLREQWEKEKEEKNQELLKQYDPKTYIHYTLEELIEGIKKKEQYIYTLRLEFEDKKLLDGRITIPFIKDFFDVVDDEPQTALLASNLRNVTMTFSDTPCQRVEHTMEDWIAKIENSMKALHLHMKLEQKKVIGNMGYICCTMPTSQGRLYNVIFEMVKGDRTVAGALNCLEKDKEGMGLLLEAIAHVIEERNR